jgi:two-component system response regulator DctR
MDAMPENQILTPAVCVIDGDPAVRDSLQYLCQSSGHRAIGFSTCSAFLRSLDSVGTGVTKSVICDAQLPDGTGVGLFEILQQRGVVVPFALMVSRSSARAVDHAARVGIEIIWSKPLMDKHQLTAFIGM